MAKIAELSIDFGREIINKNNTKRWKYPRDICNKKK